MDGAESEIFKKVIEHNTKEVIEMLDSGTIDPNIKSKQGTPLIIMSANTGNIELVNKLLDMGVDYNTTNGKTSLFSFIMGIENDSDEYYELVEKMISLSANVYQLDPNGITPLMYAINNIGSNLIIRLIEKGIVDANYIDSKNTPLILLVANVGNIKGVIFLLEKGIDINIVDGNGKSLLSYLIDSDDDVDFDELSALIDNVLDAGADVNKKDNDGYPPIYYAFRKYSNDIIFKLFERGVDINSSINNEPLIIVSLGFGSNLAVRMLEMGADPNTRSKNGDALIVVATQIGNRSVVKLLIKMGININTRDIKGETLVVIATIHNRTSTAIKLLELGANPNEKSVSSNTPLIILAIQSKNQKIVDKLLELHVDTNVVDENGVPPIIFALEDGNIKLANRLFALGVDKEAIKRNSKFSLKIAIENKKYEIVEYLLNIGADQNDIQFSNVIDERMLYLLLKSALIYGWKSFNYDEMIKKFGIKPVYMFIEKDNGTVINFMLRNGLSPNIYIDDKHILDIAVDEHSDFVVETLLDANSIPQSKSTLEKIFSIGIDLFFKAKKLYRSDFTINQKIKNALKMENLIRDILPLTPTTINQKLIMICNEYIDIVGLNLGMENVVFEIKATKEMFGYDSYTNVKGERINIFISYNIVADASKLCKAIEYELIYLTMIANKFYHDMMTYELGRGGTNHLALLMNTFGRVSYRGYHLFSPRPIFKLVWAENGCLSDALVVLLFFIKNPYWRQCIFNFDETSIANYNPEYESRLKLTCNTTNASTSIHNLKYLLHDFYSRLNEYVVNDEFTMCVNVKEMWAKCDPKLRDEKGEWRGTHGYQLYDIFRLYFPTLSTRYSMYKTDQGKVVQNIPTNYDGATFVLHNIHLLKYENIIEIAINEQNYNLIGMIYTIIQSVSYNHATSYYYGYDNKIYYYNSLSEGMYPTIVKSFPPTDEKGYASMLFYELAK